jgi:hypothetical protein
MAEKAFHPSRPQIPGAVSVAIETGKVPHRDLFARLVGRAVGPEFLVLMAGEAVPLFHGEFVRPIAVALGAFDLFVEDMFCVIPRPADVGCIRKLLIPFPMAAETERSGDNDLAMPRRNGPLSEEGKAVHLDDLVFFGCFVAGVAVYARMFASRPLLVGLVMHMAGETGIRVVFEIIIDLVGDGAHGDNEQQGGNGDNDLGLIRKFIGEPREKSVEQRDGIQGHFMLLITRIFRFTVLMARGEPLFPDGDALPRGSRSVATGKTENGGDIHDRTVL